MPAYRMVYGDDEEVVRQTFQNVQVDREDGGPCCSAVGTPSCGCGTNTCGPWNCWTKRPDLTPTAT
jgi:hypothetical protein